MPWTVLIVAVIASSAAEPAGIARALKGASAAVVDAAVADPALETCRALVRQPVIEALPCRLAVVARLVTTPPKSATELTARQALLDDVLAAAAWASAYESAGPVAGLRRSRLEAHKRACQITFAGAALLDGVVSSDPLHKDARASAASLRIRGCACAQRSVSLAVGADAPPAEQAELQGLVTSERCLLTGTDHTDTGPRGPDDLSRGSPSTQQAAVAASPAGRLVSFAEGRAVEFKRCTDKAMANGQITDIEVLGRCTCGVIGRWRLPVRKDDPRIDAALPVGAGVVVPVVVDGGAVASCGPARMGP